MTDLETMIRSWADGAAEGRAAPVTADEAIERSTALRPRRARRVPLLAAAAAAILVLAAAGALVLGTRGRGGDDVRAGLPKQTTTSNAPADVALRFRPLGQADLGADAIGTIDAATTRAELDDLWTAAGLGGPAPTVDFERQVVVSLVVANICETRLSELDRVSGVIRPTFIRTTPACSGPLRARSFVVAIDWERAGPMLHLHLMKELGLDLGGRDLVVTQVDLGAERVPTTAAACVAGNPAGQDLTELPPEVAGVLGDGGSAWGRGSLYTIPIGADVPVQDVDGRHDVKLAWFRVAPGELTLSAARLGGGGTFIGEVPSGYQPVGLQVSGLSFDRAGCWVVTGRHDDGSERTFRLWVA